MGVHRGATAVLDTNARVESVVQGAADLSRDQLGLITHCPDTEQSCVK